MAKKILRNTKVPTNPTPTAVPAGPPKATPGAATSSVIQGTMTALNQAVSTFQTTMNNVSTNVANSNKVLSGAILQAQGKPGQKPKTPQPMANPSPQQVIQSNKPPTVPPKVNPAQASPQQVVNNKPTKADSKEVNVSQGAIEFIKQLLGLEINVIKIGLLQGHLKVLELFSTRLANSLKNIITKFGEAMKDIQVSPEYKIAQQGLDMVKNIISIKYTPIDYIRNGLGLKLLAKVTKDYTEIMLRTIQDLLIIPSNKRDMERMDKVKAITGKVAGMFQLKIPVKAILDTIISLEVIKKVIPKFQSTLIAMAGIQVPPKLVQNTDAMAKSINHIKTTVSALILLTPLSIILTMMSPVLMAGMAALVLIFKAVGFLTSFINLTQGPNVAMGIARMGLIILGLVGLMGVLSLASLLMKSAMAGLLQLVLFLGVLTIFTAGLALFGAVALAVAPLLTPVLMLVGAITLVVGGIMLIGAFLALLQLMSLDKRKIMENVSLVLGIVGEMVVMITQSIIPPSEGDSKWDKFVNMVLGSIAGKVTMLMGAGMVVAAVFAVGGILVIASMLRLLSLIDMVKIREGAGMAKEVMKFVIDLMLNLTAGVIPNTSQDTKWDKVLNMILGSTASAVTILMNSVSVVAAVVAVGSILAIAGMLRLLAEIDMNLITKGKDMAQQIILHVRDLMHVIAWGTPEETPKESTTWGKMKAFFESVLAGAKGLVDTIGALGQSAMLITTAVSVGAIWGIAKMVQGIANITTQTLEMGVTRAKQIMSAAQRIKDIVNWDAPVEQNKRAGGVLGWVTDLGKNVMGGIKSGLETISNVGMSAALATTLLVVGNVKEMSDMIASINKVNIQPEAIGRKVGNMTGSVALMNTALSKTIIQPDQNNLIRSSLKTIRSNANDLDGIVKSINGMPVNPQAWNEKITSISKWQASLKEFANVTGVDVKNSKALTENYIQFVEKVDKADINKLKATEKIMEHWANLSRSINGNFQGFAGALNEHIMPALKKLDETMKEVAVLQDEVIRALSDPGEVPSVGGLDVGGPSPVSSGSPMSTPPSPLVAEVGTVPHNKPKPSTSGPSMGEVGTKERPMYVKILS